MISVLLSEIILLTVVSFVYWLTGATQSSIWHGWPVLCEFSKAVRVAVISNQNWGMFMTASWLIWSCRLDSPTFPSFWCLDLLSCMCEHGLSQWKTALQCNVMSHWLSSCPEWSLRRSLILLRWAMIPWEVTDIDILASDEGLKGYNCLLNTSIIIWVFTSLLSGWPP